MRSITLTICAVLLSVILAGCNGLKNEEGKPEESYDGIPSTAKLMAEDSHYAVFTNVEAYGEQIADDWLALEQVSLWAYDKQEQKAEKMMLSHLNTRGDRYDATESFSMPADSILTIQSVHIISFPNEPLTVLVEECSDYRNVNSFIVEQGKAEAICLPTSQGFVGFSAEEHLLIMQSYDYYRCGGRYDRIEAFDRTGKRICSMDAKLERCDKLPSLEDDDLLEKNQSPF